MLPSPAGREASSGVSAPPYVRHRPERSLLYQIVEKYYPAFKAHLLAQGTDLPGFVEQEFEGYLKCGRLEHGFLRVRCDARRMAGLPTAFRPQRVVAAEWRRHRVDQWTAARAWWAREQSRHRHH